MIVKRLEEILGTEREIRAENWTSRRLILRDAGMGFSLHDTLIHAGTSTEIHYQHHLEAVYCVGGRGSIRVLETGEVFELSDGTVYALNGHERHLLTAETEMRMVCVFNPALAGTETHDENGVYPLIQEVTEEA